MEVLGKLDFDTDKCDTAKAFKCPPHIILHKFSQTEKLLIGELPVYF